MELTRRHLLTAATCITAACITATSGCRTKRSTPRIAMASNLAAVWPKILRQFRETHPSIANAEEVEGSFGSSGTWFTQIGHGAPYHLFLSADREYPILLHQKLGPDQSGKPFLYTRGKIVLWIRHAANGFEEVETFQDLQTVQNRKILIADPKLAPYGIAAMQAIQWLSHNASGSFGLQTITAPTISGVAQMVRGGAADAGLIAGSSAMLDSLTGGRIIEIEPAIYDPIEQWALTIVPPNATAAELATTQTFAKYIVGEPAQTIFLSAGYLPITQS